MRSASHQSKFLLKCFEEDRYLFSHSHIVSNLRIRYIFKLKKKKNQSLNNLWSTHCLLVQLQISLYLKKIYMFRSSFLSRQSKEIQPWYMCLEPMRFLTEIWIYLFFMIKKICYIILNYCFFFVVYYYKKLQYFFFYYTKQKMLLYNIQCFKYFSILFLIKMNFCMYSNGNSDEFIMLRNEW